MAKKRTRAAAPQKPQPTLEDLRKFADQVEARYGENETLAFANVTYTQLSIARHYGGCKVQGQHFVYNQADDSLIREDVVKLLVALRDGKEPKPDKPAKKTAKPTDSGWKNGRRVTTLGPIESDGQA